MKKIGLATGYGVATIFIIIILTSLIFSLLLKFTSIEEESLTWIILAISFLTLFVGGFVSGGKGKEKGWLMGGATGILYSLIVFLFQYLGHDTLFSTEQSIYHLGFLATAMIGGIFGVNMTTPPTRNNA
ncbi:TIGR04086 family membrane protein [Litchfieldia salsa]|uniref:Putative membrane protein, TIGR04086 family n=1 Tax=Litchfieldia salsa TaxID=930152 RepID=A0A1H0V599_9BACI|nr:TIGR04086 family membrane protein [Litchfieldia salsa]SDP73610.1 putative membrane protein, TIGR04086 family [Litchfieldia salsa]